MMAHVSPSPSAICILQSWLLLPIICNITPFPHNNLALKVERGKLITDVLVISQVSSLIGNLRHVIKISSTCCDWEPFFLTPKIDLCSATSSKSWSSCVGISAEAVIDHELFNWETLNTGCTLLVGGNFQLVCHCSNLLNNLKRPIEPSFQLLTRSPCYGLLQIWL